MIVSVASQSSSPGVTTLAALLAWLWPVGDPAGDGAGTERLVVEADTAGGVLAARWHEAHGLTLEPGLIDLAAAQARAGQSADGDDERGLAEVAQWIAPGLGIVPAPPRPDQTAASLRALSERGADRLAAADTTIVADCGRLSATSPALGLVARSVVTVVVCRPRLDEIQRLAPLVDELRPLTRAVVLATVGDRPYDPVEVAEHLGVELIGVVADDPRWAESVRTDGFAAARLGRSELVRSVAPIAARLAHLSVTSIR